MISACFRLVLATALAALLVSSCQSTSTLVSPVNAQVLLLGETHDNGEGHRLRTDELRERLQAGWRPAIAMEQFDREQQPALDVAMRECPDAGCVVIRLVPGKSGWNWNFYKPVIELAMHYKLPLLAANLSRADAGKVIKKGVAAALDPEQINRFGLAKPLPAGVLSAQIEEIRSSHCGMLPDEMLQPMALAQIARDVVMAETLRPFAKRGVVLLAGNGHVRRDIGVPFWLHAQGWVTVSVGFVEQAGTPGQFDRELRIRAIQRPDPCASLKGRGGKPG